MTAEEVWKPIPGRGPFEASSLGRIRNSRTGNVLKLRNRLNGRGGWKSYLSVSVRLGNGDGRKTTTIIVHKAVALAFHGYPDDALAEVHHIDRDPINNRPENLEWLCFGKHVAAHRDEELEGDEFPFGANAE